MRAGVKEIVITPDFPVLLAGFPEPKDRYSRSIHDDLFAHCFYLEANGEEYCIVTLDMLCYPKWLVADMRRYIQETAGIKKENCLISTTHTHSGPEARAVPFYPEKEFEVMYPRYLDDMAHNVANAILEAKNNAFEAEIGIGKGYCGPEQNVGGNRRDRGGIADTGVFVIGIKDMTGVLRGAIVRYSLHPTFLGAENREITCDYPGYIYKTLKNEFENIVPAFQIGTAGDQSPRFFRSGCTFEEAERVGATIGNEAIRVLKQMQFSSDIEIKTYCEDVIPVRKDIPTYEQAVMDLENSENELKSAIENNFDKGTVRSLECAVIGAKRMLGLATIGKETVYSLNGHHPFEVFLMRIGEFAILALPTETFVTYGLQIQEKSPFEHTVVVTCANGYGRGYICTPEAFEEGGYEALGSLYTGENGDNLVSCALKLLNKAKEAVL